MASELETVTSAGNMRRTPRTKYSMAVLWGFDEPIQDADTDNVSAEGMFLVTSDPADPGATVKLNVSLEGRAIPLTARVVWSRHEPAPGLPVGMGVALTRAPEPYSRFVQGLM